MAAIMTLTVPEAQDHTPIFASHAPVAFTMVTCCAAVCELWPLIENCSGQVAKVGPGVRRIKPGDRVAIYHISGCNACEDCRTG